MIKVDTTTLSSVVNQCFNYAMDGRVPQPQQNMFLAEGKRLRGLLMNLLSAQFDAGAQAVLNANKELTIVNKGLSDSAASLANCAQTLNGIASLVKNLDSLLNVAAKFI
jgi:hypothetical protein